MSHPPSVVQRLSVQAQLQALQQEIGSLRSETDANTRERCQLENQLQGLRKEQKILTNESREAQTALGSFHGQRASWNEERARLTRQMEQDRQTLIECAQEAERCEAEEIKLKSDYCRTMTEMIATKMDLLGHFENARLRSLLIPETVEYLHRLWFEKNKKTSGDCSAAMEQDDEEKTLDGGKKIGLGESVAIWKKASEKWCDEKDNNERREQQVLTFQYQVLSNESLGVRQRDVFKVCYFGPIAKPIVIFVLEGNKRRFD